MLEIWKEVEEYEGYYEVSNLEWCTYKYNSNNSILECSTYFLVSSKIIEKCLTNNTPIQGFSLKFNNKKFMEVNNFMSSRMVVAAAKRVNKLTINLQNKKAKLEEKQRELEEDKLALEKMIEANEAGVKALTGGFTSEQVLNGEMELAMSQPVESPAEAPVEETVCGVSVSDLQAQDNVLRAEEAPVNPFGLKLDETSPLPFEV